MSCGDQDYSGCSCTHDVQPSYHPQLDPCVYLAAIVSQLERLNDNLEKLQHKRPYDDRASFRVDLDASPEFRELLRQLSKK